MLAVLDVDRIYKFRYHGQNRIALVREFKDSNLILCWDFTSDGYRTFYEPAISGEIEDVTDICVISDPQHVNRERMIDDPNVHTFERDNRFYAVSF